MTSWESQDQNCKSSMPVFPEPVQTAVTDRAAKEIRQEKRGLFIKTLICLTNLFVFHTVS